MNERNAYAEVLADLRRQRDELDVLIAGLETRGASAGAAASEIADIDSTTFYGMKIGEAALKYLRMVKRTQTAPEIAAALEGGGLANESTSFTNTVYATLTRDHGRRGEIIRLPERKWGLAADYPEAARKRSAESGKKKNGDATDDAVMAALRKSAESGDAETI